MRADTKMVDWLRNLECSEVAAPVEVAASVEVAAPVEEQDTLAQSLSWTHVTVGAAAFVVGGMFLFKRMKQ